MTLVPAHDDNDDALERLAAGQDVSRLIADLAAGVRRAYDDHIAPDTRNTYREGWADYLRFVEILRGQGMAAQITPEGPGDTRHLATLAMWLVWCCEHREVIYRDGTGAERVRQVGLNWSTVQTRLAGVVKELEAQGVPNPRSDFTFRRILDGLARRHTRPPVKVAALTGERLRMAIDATVGHDPLALRDQALIALVAAGVRAGRLPELRWEQLLAGDTHWTVASPLQPLVLRGREDQPEVCPIRALARWRHIGLGGPRNGPVFPALDDDGRVCAQPDGSLRVSSKQPLVKRVRSWARAAGVPVADGLSLPALDDEAALQLLDALGRPSALVVRDRSVLSLGVTAASRRRNLAEFIVGDVAFEERGMLVTFRRSKTDQYGARPRVADIARVGGRYCPVALTEAWLARYAEALGRPLRSDDPLYCRLDRWGNVVVRGGRPVPLTRPSFSEIVRSRAAAAGLVGRYRSHSLRRGLATGLAKKKVPLQEIARRGGWKSLDVGYIEEGSRFESSIAALLELEPEAG